MPEENPVTFELKDDTLTVTVERQVANFGDHTTVRAHLATTVAPPGEGEDVDDYQSRLTESVGVLATPLKVAVLTELGLPFKVVGKVVLEDVQTERSEKRSEDGPRQEAPREPRPAPAGLPAFTWDDGEKRFVPATVPQWVQEAAAAYPWATEITTARRKDGKGSWYKARNRNGGEEYLNRPRPDAPATSDADMEEPF